VRFQVDIPDAPELPSNGEEAADGFIDILLGLPPVAWTIIAGLLIILVIRRIIRKLPDGFKNTIIVVLGVLLLLAAAGVSMTDVFN
jgi:hypothetical protein